MGTPGEHSENLTDIGRDFHLLPDACDASDRQLVKEMVSWITSGAVTLEQSNDRWFRLLESRFPIGMNRIDWSFVDHIHKVDVFADNLPEYPLSIRLSAITPLRTTIATWLMGIGFAKDDVVVVVCDVSNLSWTMTIQTFLDCYQVFFSSGQNVYVLPTDARWCVNYSPEDQLFFGEAKHARRHGCIDDET